MQINKGYYMELIDRSTSRILFSAATDEITEAAFKALWVEVGNTVRNGMNRGADRQAYFELRVTPIIG